MKQKLKLLVLCLLMTPGWSFAQNSSEPTKEDTASVNAILQKSKNLLNVSQDSAIIVATQAKNISEKINYPLGKAKALKNIGIGYYRQSKYLEAINYWTESLKVYESLDDQNGIANISNNMAAVFSLNSDDVKALEYSLRSLKISEKLGDTLRIFSALNTIASIYNKKSATKDTALNYLSRALSLAEKMGKTEDYGVLAENIGEIYLEKGDDAKEKKDNRKTEEYYAKADEYFNISIKALGTTLNSPYAYNGLAKLYLRKDNTEQALKYHNTALDIAEKSNGKNHIMESLEGIANVYVKKNDFPTALNYFNKSEALAKELNIKNTLKDIYKEKSDTYKEIGDYKNAYTYQGLVGDIKDSIFNETTEKKLGFLQFEFDLDKKQNEISLLTKDKDLQVVQTKKQRFAKNAFMIGLFLAFTIALLVFRSYRVQKKTHKLVDQQKDEIEHLLLNILPQEVAQELKTKGRATPRQYESVSVMFTDFKGFTILADRMSPDELVKELDECFNAFDGIIEKYQLEKIKTIGDSYMCAGGIPRPDENHVLKIVKAGLEIQQFVSENNERRREKGMAPWTLRIGIHVGSVVAGVVGKKKYAYDIWGSTVNIASRMESNGEPGKVNISSSTYELIKDYYECTYRGKISAKNIGEIDMYFIGHEHVIPKNLLLTEKPEMTQ
jgi:class 3 adenylate cyclase/tetratricopeptide (TPR) repeat protein